MYPKLNGENRCIDLWPSRGDQTCKKVKQSFTRVDASSHAVGEQGFNFGRTMLLIGTVNGVVIRLVAPVGSSQGVEVLRIISWRWCTKTLQSEKLHLKS